MGMVEHTITAKIKADAEPLVRKFRKAQGATRALDRDMGRFRKGVGSVRTALLPKNLPIMAAAMAMGTLGKKAIQTAADMQQTKFALQGILGSASQGNKFFKELAEFAAKTPFEFSGLAKMSQQLLGAGTAAKEIIPTLHDLGSGAAALGVGTKEIDRMVLAMTQIAGAGRLTGEEIRQIRNAMPGFNTEMAVANYLGISQAEAFEKIRAGAIDADTALAAIREGMKKIPGAANALERQAGTLNQVFSNLKDTLEVSMFEALEDDLPRISGAIRDNMGSIEGVSTSFANAVGSTLTGLVPILAKVGEAFIPFFDIVAEMASRLGPQLTTTVSTIIDSFLMFMEAIQPLRNTALQMATTLLQMLNPALESVLNIVTPLISAFGGFLPVLLLTSKYSGLAYGAFGKFSAKVGKAKGNIIAFAKGLNLSKVSLYGVLAVIGAVAAKGEEWSRSARESAQSQIEDIEKTATSYEGTKEALAKLEKQYEANKAIAEKYQGSIREESDGFSNLMRSIFSTESVLSSVSEEFRGARAALDELGPAIDRLKEKQEAYTSTVGIVGEAAGLTEAQVRGLAERLGIDLTDSSGEATRQLLTATGATDTIRGVMLAAMDPTKSFAENVIGVATAAAAFATSSGIDQARKVVEELGNDIKTTDDNLKYLENRMKGFLDPAAAMAQAALDTDMALRDLPGKLQDIANEQGGLSSSSLDVQQVILDLRDTLKNEYMAALEEGKDPIKAFASIQGDIQTAFQTLKDQGIDPATISQWDLIESLRELGNEGATTETQLGLNKLGLENLAAAGQDTTVPAFMDLNTWLQNTRNSGSDLNNTLITGPMQSLSDLARTGNTQTIPMFGGLYNATWDATDQSWKLHGGLSAVTANPWATILNTNDIYTATERTRDFSGELDAAMGKTGVTSSDIRDFMAQSPLFPLMASGGQIGGGFRTNGPAVVVGEGNKAWPEFVIPTDPKYRRNAIKLMTAASVEMGLTGLAEGGIFGVSGSLATSYIGKVGVAFVKQLLELVKNFGGKDAQITRRAEQYFMGAPYVWGGTSRSGSDCSGVFFGAARELGISLPRTAAAQAAALKTRFGISQASDLYGSYLGNSAAGGPSGWHTARSHGDGTTVEQTRGGSKVGRRIGGRFNIAGLNFDGGGLLPPGLSLVYNGTRRFERVLAPGQGSDVTINMTITQRDGESSERLAHRTAELTAELVAGVR